MERYVSRSGDKLEFALRRFGIDVSGKTAADLGSHVGGFVDCLLRHGAARVYSVDTCYGTLAWKLRRDSRVVVLERTNALHVELPELVDIVTVDVGWTRQAVILPRAVLLVGRGVVLSLLKPQYEAEPGEVERGVLRAEAASETVRRVIEQLDAMAIHVADWAESPLRSNKGNLEFFLRIDVN